MKGITMSKTKHTYALQLCNENDGQAQHEYKSLSVLLFILWIKSICKRRWVIYDFHRFKTIRFLVKHYTTENKENRTFKPLHPRHNNPEHRQNYYSHL